jgi:hypothetical protein
LTVHASRRAPLDVPLAVSPTVARAPASCFQERAASTCGQYAGGREDKTKDTQQIDALTPSTGGVSHWHRSRFTMQIKACDTHVHELGGAPIGGLAEPIGTSRGLDLGMADERVDSTQIGTRQGFNGCAGSLLWHSHGQSIVPANRLLGKEWQRRGIEVSTRARWETWKQEAYDPTVLAATQLDRCAIGVQLNQASAAKVELLESGTRAGLHALRYHG